MKTVGEQAQEFRLNRGWNSTRMAKEVGTSRQNIESMEDNPGRTPRYITKLAKTMCVTVDDLLNGRYDAKTTPRPEQKQSGDTSTHTYGIAPQPVQAGSADDATEGVASLVMKLGAALGATDPITRAQTGPILEQLHKTPELAAELGARLEATIAMGTSQTPFTPFNPFPKK